MIDFAIDEELKPIVSEFGYSNNGVIQIAFAEVYNKKTVYSIFKLKDISKSFKELNTNIKEQVPDIVKEHYDLIKKTIYKNIDSIAEDDLKDNVKSEIPKKEHLFYKYGSDIPLGSVKLSKKL